MYELRRGNKRVTRFLCRFLNGHQPEYHSVVDSDPNLKTGSDLFYIKSVYFFLCILLDDL